jgi:hypothetical protein
MLTYHPSDQLEQTKTGHWGTYFGEKLIWNARKDKLRKSWLSRGWKPCRVPLDGFQERNGAEWSSEDKTMVAGLYRGDEVVVVTRQATLQEYRVLHHHRVPMRIEGDNQYAYWFE